MTETDHEEPTIAKSVEANLDKRSSYEQRSPRQYHEGSTFAKRMEASLDNRSPDAVQSPRE